jgi:hypothetical protein
LGTHADIDYGFHLVDSAKESLLVWYERRSLAATN